MNRYIILFLLSSSLLSCKKFDTLNIYMKNSKLYFTNSEMVSECNNGLYITDFSVNYYGQDGGKIAWRISRDDFPRKELVQNNFPLLYGEKIDGLITNYPAIELNLGKYSYGGTIFCLKGEQETGYDVLGGFHILEDQKIEIL